MNKTMYTERQMKLAKEHNIQLPTREELATQKRDDRIKERVIRDQIRDELQNSDSLDWYCCRNKEVKTTLMGYKNDRLCNTPYVLDAILYPKKIDYSDNRYEVIKYGEFLKEALYRRINKSY